MKKIILFITIILMSCLVQAQDRVWKMGAGDWTFSYVYKTGDTVGTSDAWNLWIRSSKAVGLKYSLTVKVHKVSGAPNGYIVLLGRATSADEWTHVDSVLWTDSGSDSIATLTNTSTYSYYNWWAVQVYADGTTQRTKIKSVDMQFYGDYAHVVTGDLSATGSITAGNGVNLGTSKALIGTTAMTIGAGTQTVAVNSSDWDIGATGAMTGIGAITMDGVLTFGNAEYINNTTNGTLDVGNAALSASLYNWVAASGITGTADTVLINTVPDITVVTGTEISFINEIANTAAVYVNVDGAGYIQLEEYTGGTLNALDANDMIIGQTCKITYNGTVWILTSNH
jgi:hypothetical protein